GDVHRALTEIMGVPEDRRLNPLLTGSRAGTAGKVEGVLLPKPGGEIFAKLRSDWIAFAVKGSETPYTAPAARQDSGAAPGARTVTPAAVPDTGVAGQDLRPVYREKPAPAAKKGIEERLMILNDLRNKKLITDEEYRTKRMDILNDL
ncbi:MAG TPA: SHOCT domain-containing protein, partial [Geobacteraceae bacterium]|nr:SHOCT domain-containing protein [Geobacteraceae bacterium]